MATYDADQVELRIDGRPTRIGPDGLIGVPVSARDDTLRAERDGLANALEAQCWEHAANCCAKWCPKCQAGDAALMAIGRRPPF